MFEFIFNDGSYPAYGEGVDGDIPSWKAFDGKNLSNQIEFIWADSETTASRMFELHGDDNKELLRAGGSGKQTTATYGPKAEWDPSKTESAEANTML